MANAIIKALIKLINKFINLLLIPINAIISTAIPDFSSYLDYLFIFLNYCTNFFGYIVDMLCIPQPIIYLCILTIIYKITISVAVYAVKLSINWYRALMP